MGCSAISTWCICAWKAEVPKKCCYVTAICSEPLCCARRSLLLCFIYYLNKGNVPLLTRKKLRTGILFSLALAIVVMTAIALYGDLPRVVVALAQFRWTFLPLILGLTLY